MGLEIKDSGKYHVSISRHGQFECFTVGSVQAKRCRAICKYKYFEFDHAYDGKTDELSLLGDIKNKFEEIINKLMPKSKDS